MAVKWTCTDTGVQRDGVLVAELDSTGNLKAVEGHENYISAASKQWNNNLGKIKPNTPPGSIVENNGAGSTPGPETPGPGATTPPVTNPPGAGTPGPAQTPPVTQTPEKAETKIPAPPAMDPAKGAKTPAYKAWKDKYNPTDEQLEQFHPTPKKRGKR